MKPWFENLRKRIVSFYMSIPVYSGRPFHELEELLRSKGVVSVCIDQRGSSYLWRSYLPKGLLTVYEVLTLAYWCKKDLLKYNIEVNDQCSSLDEIVNEDIHIRLTER